MGEGATVEPSPDRDLPFPPWWVIVVTACIISVLAFGVLFLSGVRENVSDPERSRQNLGIGLIVIAVLPAWLSYFYANHGHALHSAVAYCLGVGLCAVGLVIASPLVSFVLWAGA